MTLTGGSGLITSISTRLYIQTELYSALQLCVADLSGIVSINPQPRAEIAATQSLSLLTTAERCTQAD